METRGRSPRYLNLFLNIAGLGFGDRRKVTLSAKEDPFAVNFSSVPPRYYNPMLDILVSKYYCLFHEEEISIP
jgi:hypothetical protein